MDLATHLVWWRDFVLHPQVTQDYISAVYARGSNWIYRGMPTIVLLVVAAIFEFMAIHAFA